MRRAMIVIGLVIVFLIAAATTYVFFPALFGYQKTSTMLVPTRCAKPSPHAIATEREAILAARSIWYCTNPDYDHTSIQTNEQAWLRDFKAYRTKGVTPTIADLHAEMRSNLLARLIWNLSDAKGEYVWHVVQMLPEGYAGGGLNFEIAARDGRLIDFIMTQ